MNHISVTILTRNEASLIGDCLESLQGIADEIIVVDSFSDDDTVKICRDHGCKVIQRQFNGYGTLRQYATSLTTHNYVLSVDADEVISSELKQSILKLKQEGFAHRVYSIRRQNFFCGIPVKRCGWHPDDNIRLFNKRYANWNLRDIKEQVIFPDSLRPEPIKGQLLHYRCTSQQELDATEDRHAGLKSHIIAANNIHISPLTPILKGIGAYLSTYLRHGGIFEGKVGRKISGRNFRSEIMAYRLARRILKRRAEKEISQK